MGTFPPLGIHIQRSAQSSTLTSIETSPSSAQSSTLTSFWDISSGFQSSFELDLCPLLVLYPTLHPAPPSSPKIPVPDHLRPRIICCLQQGGILIGVLHGEGTVQQADYSLIHLEHWSQYMGSTCLRVDSMLLLIVAPLKNDLIGQVDTVI